jgi:hypothetical protein
VDINEIIHCNDLAQCDTVKIPQMDILKKRFGSWERAGLANLGRCCGMKQFSI